MNILGYFPHFQIQPGTDFYKKSISQNYILANLDGVGINSSISLLNCASNDSDCIPYVNVSSYVKLLLTLNTILPQCLGEFEVDINCGAFIQIHAMKYSTFSFYELPQLKDILNIEHSGRSSNRSLNSLISNHLVDATRAIDISSYNNTVPIVKYLVPRILKKLETMESSAHLKRLISIGSILKAMKQLNISPNSRLKVNSQAGNSTRILQKKNPHLKSNNIKISSSEEIYLDMLKFESNINNEKRYVAKAQNPSSRRDNYKNYQHRNIKPNLDRERNNPNAAQIIDSEKIDELENRAIELISNRDDYIDILFNAIESEVLGDKRILNSTLHNTPILVSVGSTTTNEYSALLVLRTRSGPVILDAISFISLYHS